MKKLKTEQEFEDLKKQSNINIIKFGQQGCMPCMIAGETLNELDFGDSVDIYECENVDLMEKLEISSLPVIYVIKKEYEERIDAYACLDELADKLNDTVNWLKNN